MGELVIASSLSTIYPFASTANVKAIQTLRLNTPLPPAPNPSDPPADHASFSSVVGSVLLRVLHAGLIVELVSLSTGAPPVRFAFPAAIVSNPAVVLSSDGSELHILAVISSGSLYRIVVPADPYSWTGALPNNWQREHLIKNVQNVQGVVHVHSAHSVAIGLPNGTLLRLDCISIGDEEFGDSWTETLFQNSSMFSAWTSYLHAPAPTPGSEIISMAAHPWPTDINHVWTMSRDRTVRLWQAKMGCVAAKILGPPDSKTVTLLEAEHQTLLRVFSTEDGADVYLLAFVPTPSSSATGGMFQILRVVEETMHEVGTVACSEASAHGRLQDFMVANNKLYTLWDRQGQSTVEYANFGLKESNPFWQPAAYAPEPELAPAYLDQLLLPSGSLTDKFFDAIMRPGMFSTLTLRTAVDQYMEACLSLPGPHPAQLEMSYGTLGEAIAAIVGSTVRLVRDPHTGALQHGKYWNALKRDWEGFIARCREVERSARWPLALGLDEKSAVTVIERERVGSLIIEDAPLTLYRRLMIANSMSSEHDLLDVLWQLRSNLGHQVMLEIENGLTDVMHEEIAFSYIDIVRDQASRIDLSSILDEGFSSWVNGRLQAIGNLDHATRVLFDVIAGTSPHVKEEEDEEQEAFDLALPPPHTDFTRSLTAAFASTTIHARYDICLSLLTLLYFVADDLHTWHPTLLEELFAMFRGIAVLRYLARQPASQVAQPEEGDELVRGMMNMQTVSHSRAGFTPMHSLIHRLLPEYADPHGVLYGAHQFMDSTGLLSSPSTGNVSSSELVLCERLRLLGYQDATRETLGWFPRTPGIAYVQSRLWLDVGRIDDAADAMEKVAGSFVALEKLHPEDQEALAAVLPGGRIFESDFVFYLHAAALFKVATHTHHEVAFAQLALSCAPLQADTWDLWYAVIKGQIDLGLYDDAYSALIATPHEKIQRECVSTLVYHMCEANLAIKTSVARLMTYNFAGFAEEVEEALSFKARNADPRVEPFYSKILYTWFIHRGDYRNAALTMYQRARKLSDLMLSQPSIALAAAQAESYMVAINALSLLDPKSAWIIMPASKESVHEPRKRRKLTKHIPEDRYGAGKTETEIVDLADIQYEYALLNARLDLCKTDPSMSAPEDFQLAPTSIILRLAQTNRFNTAMATARSLKVDMSDIFTHLTAQCLRLSRNSKAVIQQDTSDWLLTDKVSSWPGTPAERGWRHLRQSLERHDGPESDFAYTKTTLETIMALDRHTPPPPWLVQSLKQNHPEYLIRISLRFDLLEYALEYTSALIRTANAQLARDLPKDSSSTWLPYTLIDQVLAVTASHVLTPKGLSLRQELDTELGQRVERMQKLSNFAK